MAAAGPMKTLTVRLPESLCTEIARAAGARRISKSEIIREWLEEAAAERMPLIDELDDLEAFALMAQLLGVGRPAEPMAIVTRPPKRAPRAKKRTR